MKVSTDNSRLYHSIDFAIRDGRYHRYECLVERGRKRTWIDGLPLWRWALRHPVAAWRSLRPLARIVGRWHA